MSVSEIEKLTNTQLLRSLGFVVKNIKNTPEGLHKALKQMKPHPTNPEQSLLICEFAKRWNKKPQQLNKLFNVPSEIYEYFRFRLCEEKQEHLYVIFLDFKYRFISEHLVSKGTMDSTVAIPRDVFRHAISEDAAYVIVAHNHVAGDPSPSKDDIASTKRLAEAGKIIGIKLADHIIVGHDTFFSMSKHNLI